eukprot:scaffold1075_cov104-Cylindrotheca_fusiformis.AAC.6
MNHIVQEDQRDQWNTYAAQQIPLWYQESIDHEEYTEFTPQELVDNMTIPFLHFYDPENDFLPTPVSGPGEALAYFQIFPFELFLGNPTMLTNLNALQASEQVAELYNIMKATRRPSIGFTRIPIDLETTIPGSFIMQPVFDGADTEAEERKMGAILIIRIPWMGYFKNALTKGQDGIVVVLESACPKLVEAGISTGRENLTESDRNIITYQVDGPDAVLLGDSDLHDPKYEALAVSEVFIDLDIDPSQLPEGACVPVLTLHVYPSAELEASFRTDNSIIYTVVVVVIFVFTSLVFLLYDFSVGRRQRTVMDRIAKQDRIRHWRICSPA